MRDNLEGSELDPAVGVRRRCKNSSLKSGHKKVVTVEAKSGQSQRARLGRASFSEEIKSVWQKSI